MGKDKYRRFQENLTFANMVQPDFEEVFGKEYRLKGHWHDEFFRNPNPIILELGCGRGEYTVALAERNPDRNYIGIDIKGARMWRGAKTATERGMANAAFLRTRIEFINSFFASGEVDEIWITFPDPQLKKQRVKKRLTSPQFLGYYAKFLKPDGVVHLKTDSRHLHEYTKAVIERNALPLLACGDDIYGTGMADTDLSIQTAYERKFREQGLPITYLRFMLGGRSEFEVPDFEEDDNLDASQLGVCGSIRPSGRGDVRPASVSGNGGNRIWQKGRRNSSGLVSSSGETAGSPDVFLYIPYIFPVRLLPTIGVGWRLPDWI